MQRPPRSAISPRISQLFSSLDFSVEFRNSAGLFLHHTPRQGAAESHVSARCAGGAEEMRKTETRKRKCKDGNAAAPANAGENCRPPSGRGGNCGLLFVGRFAGDDGQVLAVAPVFPGAVVHFCVVAEHFCGEIKSSGALADVAVTHHQIPGLQPCGAK